MGQCRKREVKRSALAGKPAAELFALINGIERHPQFLPWCTHARVQSRSQQEIVATLGIRRGALHGEFTTRNTLEPERSIRMQLVSGPFRTLQGEWRLLAHESNSCPQDLNLRFAFRQPAPPPLVSLQIGALNGALLDVPPGAAAAP